MYVYKSYMRAGWGSREGYGGVFPCREVRDPGALTSRGTRGGWTRVERCPGRVSSSSSSPLSASSFFFFLLLHFVTPLRPFFVNWPHYCLMRWGPPFLRHCRNACRKVRRGKRSHLNFLFFCFHWGCGGEKERAILPPWLMKRTMAEW